MTNQPTGIAPGIYYDLPAEEYHADPALSSSGLKKLLQNPMEYWSTSPLNPDREPVDTVAMKNGRASHCLLLEPHNFNKDFIVLPPVNDIKIESDIWTRLEATEDGKYFKLPETKAAKVVRYTGSKSVISEGDYADMTKAVQVIREHPTLSKLLEGGKPEVSIFWRDEATGIMCRCRFDYLLPRIAFDYKRTINVYLKEKIGYTIADFGYDISAPMYIEGLKNAGLYDADTHLGFVLLFQMGKSPFVPRAVRLDDRIMEMGHSRFRFGLELYKFNIEKYGTAPWSAGYDAVEDMTLEDMPFSYRR